ncbi:MAG TPA: hypothetical protein VGJ18_05650 [Gemmatimonadaceae bacterium]|jgi:hypothetical protein
MRRLVLAGVAMLLVACGGDKTTGPETVSGTYTLRTVNGTAVPMIVYQDSQEKDELLAGNVTLSADNSWSGLLSIRATDLSSGQVFGGSYPIGGTYSLSGNTITLTDSPDLLSFTGTVSGGTLNIGGDIGLGTTTAFMYQK